MPYLGSPAQIVASSTAQPLAALPSTAVTASAGYVPAVADGKNQFDTTGLTFLAVDITVTAFTGGTSPTVVFFLDRLGADGNWYNMWPGNTSGQAVSTPGAFSVDVGPNGGSWSPPNGSQHAVLTQTARLRYSLTGSPTSVTFSVSVVGR